MESTELNDRPWRFEGKADSVTHRKIAWFSCGAASAVAAYLTVQKYPMESEIVYCDTMRSEHPDNARFFRDVSQWIGKAITIVRSAKYEDIDDVFESERYMSGIAGARCTVEMKKMPRLRFQRPTDTHIFGYTVEEEKRYRRFQAEHPGVRTEWILGDEFIRKADCLRILEQAGIALPAMYALGFEHNNCIGCVKATSPAYWARTAVNFPEIFQRRAKQSREIGARLVRIKGQRRFLDELDVNAYYDELDGDIECGPYCAQPEAR